MKHTQGPWIPAAVGCYWNAGDYHISTVQGGGESYYRVALKFDEIGRAQTLEEAKALVINSTSPRILPGSWKQYKSVFPFAPREHTLTLPADTIIK